MLFLLIAVIMWFSISISVSTLVISALLLSLTCVCYIIAVLRHEDAALKSNVITQQPQRSVVSRI